jgi:glycosyltransferase involved in cell wall biosynthesis
MTILDKPISVDVILPIYNGSKYVNQTIESVIKQEGNFRIKIYAVDDYSTDNSVEIIKGQKDFGNNIILHEKTSNTGVSSTRNLGISLGNSEYIAFIDQDDIWVRNKLKVQLTSLLRDDNIEYSIGLQTFFLQDPNYMPKWFREKWLSEPQLGYLPSTLIVKRRLFVNIGTFDESYVHGADDVDWFARARKAGINHEVISKVLVNRRVHSNNLSSKIGSNLEIMNLVRSHFTKEDNG